MEIVIYHLTEPTAAMSTVAYNSSNVVRSIIWITQLNM